MWLLPKATCRPSDFGCVSPISCTGPGTCARPVAGSEKPIQSRDHEVGEGIVNVEEFEKRFGVKQLTMSSD
jgi:hypothetical protein